MEGLGARFVIENHLRAAEKCNGLACLSVNDDCIPELGCLAEVNRLRDTFDHAFAGGSDMIGLEFDRREPYGFFREIGDATIACRGIGERDDASCMKKTIRCHERRLYLEFRPYFRWSHMSDDDAKIAWQVLRAELVEVIRGKHWAPKDGVEETSFRAFLRLFVDCLWAEFSSRAFFCILQVWIHRHCAVLSRSIRRNHGLGFLFYFPRTADWYSANNAGSSIDPWWCIWCHFPQSIR